MSSKAGSSSRFCLFSFQADACGTGQQSFVFSRSAHCRHVRDRLLKRIELCQVRFGVFLSSFQSDAVQQCFSFLTIGALPTSAGSCMLCSIELCHVS